MREVQVCLVFDVRNDKPVSTTCEEIYNLRDMSWFCQVLHCYIFPPQSFSSWKAPLACFTPRVMADIENVRSKSTEQHKLLRKDCITKQFPFFCFMSLDNYSAGVSLETKHDKSNKCQ